LDTNEIKDLEIERNKLVQEAHELMLILGNILKKLSIKVD
jgi:hypothetical protein